MKERPILFKPEMVQAILDGRKTMTRRVVKNRDVLLPGTFEIGDGMRHFKGKNFGTDSPEDMCKFGKVGDRLWVKEVWCHKADDNDMLLYNAEGNFDTSCVHYKVDGYEVRAIDGDGFQRWNKDNSEASPWKSPLFMPRWASRLLLEITNVRVERLDDISIIDALAEGIRCPECGYTHKDAQLHMDHAICVNKWLKECKAGRTTNHGAIDAFKALWESINGKDSWSANPWVWVIEFKVVTR